MLLAALLASGLALAGCNLADTFVLWPPGGPPNAGDAVRRVVKVDGKELEIWTARAIMPEPRAYVLRFYGNGDRAEWHVGGESARIAGAEIWGVNYPGYGGSEGRATLDGVARSAVAAYDVLVREAGGKPIFAFGTSLGTTAALHVAAARDVRGLLLVNPPALRRVIMGEYGWWNLWIFAALTANGVPDDLDSEENARRCKVPAVFVRAERDEVVPPKYQQRVLDAYAGPKELIVIPGGTHNGAMPAATEYAIDAAVRRMLDQGARH